MTGRAATVRALALGGLLLAQGGRAAASVCAEVDERMDVLSPEDRRAALIVLMHTLGRHGLPVVREGCVESYRVYHVKLGATVTVYLYGPGGGYREARASKLDELPMVYDQMVRSLLSGEPMTDGVHSLDRTNATADQMVPRRMAADNLKYARVGYGSVLGGDLVGGPSLGFGWRHELDRFGIDVSFLNLLVATDAATRGAGLTASWIQLLLLRYGDPLANASTYYGLGVSWGAAGVSDGDSDFGDTGLQLQAAAGYELFRATTIRLFGQVDVTLPLYESGGLDGAGTRYTPSVVFSTGAGFGKANTIGVVAR